MRRYLFGALVLVFGLLNSRAFCEYPDRNQDYRNPYFSLDIPEGVNDRDTSTSSSSYEEDDQEAQGNVGQKYGDGYFGENLPGGFESDPYQPRDDVAYWESIYGTEDVPDFEVPPAIDGDSIFMGIDDLTDAWEDQNEEEEAIPWKRDAEKTGSHLGRITSSVKQTRRNLENSRSSGNLDYRSMMSDVYQPHFYEQNSWQAPKTSSTFEDDQNEQLYGSRSSARTTYASNLEPETTWASNNVRSPEAGDGDIEDSQDVDTEMKSELEFTGQFPVAVESRSIKSSHSQLANSKRKIIQSKKDLINVATAGGSRAAVGDAVHRTIEAKKDFIDSVISAKASAIQHKKELIHSITGSDQSYAYSGNGQFSGNIHSRGALQSVLDSKQKIIQAKKDLIHASAVGSKAELTDAVIKTLDAKKDIVDSLLPTVSGINDKTSQSERESIDKKIIDSIIGFDHSHGHSGNSKISGSMQTQGKVQSVLSSKQKSIQELKDSIRAAAVDSGVELTEAGLEILLENKDFVDSLLSTGVRINDMTIEAKKGFIESLISAKAAAFQNKKELLHSIVAFDHSHDYSGHSRISGSTQGMFQSVMDSKRKVIQAKKDLISGVGSRAELTDAVVKTLDAKKDLVHSVLSTRAGMVHNERGFGLSTCCSANTAENFFNGVHRNEGASLKPKSHANGQIHANLQSGSIHDHHKVHETEHSSGLTTAQSQISSLHSGSSVAGNIAVEGEVGVASSSSHSNHKEKSSLVLNKEIESHTQISSSLQSGQSEIHPSEKSHHINTPKVEIGKVGFSPDVTTNQVKQSSLHSSLSGAGNIAIGSDVDIGGSLSFGNQKAEDSLTFSKKVEGSGQISTGHELGLTVSQSEVHPSEKSHQINTAKVEIGKVGFSPDVTTNQLKQSSLHSSLSGAGNIAIGSDVEIGGSLSYGNQKGEGSLSFSKKVEGSGQIYTGKELGLTLSQSEVDSSESSDQVNSSEAENSGVEGPVIKVIGTANIAVHEEPGVGISASDSSSEEISEDESDSKSIEIQISGKLGEFSSTKTEIGENTDLKSSIGGEINLIKNLGDGNVIHSGFQSNIQTATIVEGKSLPKSDKEYPAFETTDTFGIDHKNELPSIHKECEPGQCGITGKLHVGLNSKSEIDFHHQNEAKTIVESKILQNPGSYENDGEIKISCQSPISEAVIVNTGFVDEKSKESLEHENGGSEFEANEDKEVVENVLEKTPDIDDHLVIDDEEDQRTEAIISTQDAEFAGDVDDGEVFHELSDTESEDAFPSREEGGSSDEKELESVGAKSEVELETQIGWDGEIGTKQDSIALKKSSNSIIKSEISDASGAASHNKDVNELAIEQNGRYQAAVKFGNFENNSSYGEHEGLTHEREFGEQCPVAGYQLGESQKKGKISHFQLLGGSSHALLPEDVEELEAHRAFSTAHCRLINLDVNCSGMTAFMKPECQQLNAKLWHPQDSETPITLWTVKTYLSHGQELAIEMQTRAKWLCDQGLVPKLHTPAMLHLINNFATENIVEINQESECSLFGTKLLQRRLSSHFDVTPNTFIAFLQHHSFRVIGTGLCYDRPKRCPSDQMYRTFDGSCNNPNHPTWGQSNTAFARILPARYSDGVHQPPKSVTGNDLPNPRVLSTRCFSPKIISNRKITLALSQWGQMLSHDFALQTIDQTVDGGIQCCADSKRQLPKNLQHHSCLPIDIPANDKFYSKFDLRCMNFVRSMTISREDCTLGPADQLNTVTSYLDASPLYGSNKETCDRLRTFVGGRMRVAIRRGRELLPTMTNTTRFCDAMSPTEVCYLAGDVRVNQNPQLAILQTLLLREHNRLADELTILNPHWDDERVFQEARRIVIAELQCITFDEWLPLVIGKQYCQRHRLISRNRNMMSRDYNPRIKASTINGFTTAVFRSFHSMVDGNINLCPANREISHTLRLSNHFFRPQIIERSNNLDDLIRGLVTQPMQEADENFHPEITEYLFRSRNEFGIDLEAIDIQRGRDHGLPCYNAYRETCGLPRAKDFDDLGQEISQKNIEKLKEVYAHVEDIDLIVGIVMEYASPGCILGPVARCLIGEQFYRSRVGDRYFYDVADQPQSFTQEQFKEIKKTSFARLLCDTADNLREIQPRAFKMISPRNPLTSCNAFPKMDLSPWQECDCC